MWRVKVLAYETVAFSWESILHVLSELGFVTTDCGCVAGEAAAQDDEDDPDFAIPQAVSDSLIYIDETNSFSL